MRLSKLGLTNLGIVLIAQVICWSWFWTKTSPGNDTTIVDAALGIAWNLIPYGFALVLSSHKKDFEPLNIVSSMCLLFLILIYSYLMLGRGNSTSGLALLFWPILHTAGLVFITAFLAVWAKIRPTENSANGSNPKDEEERL